MHIVYPQKHKILAFHLILLIFVILSEAKNLLRVAMSLKILRFAQNDKGAVSDVKKHI